LLGAEGFEADQVLSERQVMSGLRAKEVDAVLSIQFADPHFDLLIRSGGDAQPDDVGVDRQLPAAPVHQLAEEDAAGRPKSANSSSAARMVRPV